MPANWQWHVTTAIAVLSLVLNFVQMWQRRQERKSKVRVTLATGIVIQPSPFPGRAFQIGVENHGVPDVSFAFGCASIKAEGSDRQFILTNPLGVQFPCTLRHGERLSMFADLESLNHELRGIVGPGPRKIRADVYDQLSRHYTSEWATFDVQ
jgi:hypothetical protein